MTKQLIVAACILAPFAIHGQSAIDAYNLNPYQLRGTARFTAMGGAFTALGGDLSTISQNPAGIGIYRGSEVGLTLDLDFQSSKASSGGYSLTENQTKFACDNFGYVGSVELQSETLPYIAWGVSYGRAASFDRLTRGGSMLSGSLSNYIANFTSDNNTPLQSLQFNTGYNPYFDGNADWLSILGYNAYIIKPTSDKPNNLSYTGLWDSRTTSGDTMFRTRTRGYLDEYNIDFGGNLMDIVYWGVGIGINDLEYRQDTYYDENLENVTSVPTADGLTSTPGGKAEYTLENWIHTKGSGYNAKIGVIVKPIQELRLGIAFHTPTYYNLTTAYDAAMNFAYTNTDGQTTQDSFDKPFDPSKRKPWETDVCYYDWQMRSPWRLMFGVAGVLGGKAIVSLDYEHQGYNDMNCEDGDGYKLTYTNEDIKSTFKGSDIIRLGAEYRITRDFSVRGGFNYITSNVKSEANDAQQPVYTAGCNPAYTFKKDTYNITLGAGYRFNGFYADLAYVYSHANSTWHGFNGCGFDTASQKYYLTGAPTADITDASSRVVLSVGYRF